MKVLDSKASQESQASFRFEIAIMASLPSCPNLVQLLGYIENPIAYVMKRYNYSLKDLHLNEPLASSIMMVLKIAKDICNGMRVLHSHGIIHLDLKPRKYKEL